MHQFCARSAERCCSGVVWRIRTGAFWWASVWRCGLSVENSGAPLERCKFLVHFNDGYIEESDHEGGVGEKAQ